MQTKSSIFERILSMEIKNLNESLVLKRKSLRELLLAEEEPFSYTKKGEKHFFDRKELEEISKFIPKYEHQDLKIPIFLYRDINLENFYIEGGIEEEFIKRVIDYKVKSIQGRLYLPKPIAYKIVRKFPTTVQVIWML